MNAVSAPTVNFSFTSKILENLSTDPILEN